MASENLTAAGYIKHHLQSLTQDGHSQGLKNVADFSYIHLDTMFFSIVLGAIMCFILWRGAKTATVGVPGRFQAAIELMVEFVDDMCKSIIHNDQTRKLMAPLGLTVFVWVFFRKLRSSLAASRYRCGNCGQKIGAKGVCPHCGAINE